jgi:glyoxylase-like metal-dependent hydrolase (beta-lactamase superfamily II)
MLPFAPSLLGGKTMKRMWLVLFILIASSSFPKFGEAQQATPAAAPTAPQSFPETEEMKRRGLTNQTFPRIQKLTDNVYTYEMIRAPFQGARFTTNNLIVITKDGVLVADAQGSPEDTARLVQEIKKLTDQPIKYVVICSEHVDHTGGNASFPAGVTFIAHPGAKRNFEAQANNPNRTAASPRVVIPNDIVIDKKVLNLGGTEIQILNLGRAHVGTDLTVYLPKEQVLFLSETYFHKLFPALRTGFPSEWIQAIKKAESMDVRFYVPGHGYIDDARTMKADLTESRKVLELAVSEARRLYKPGMSPAEAFKQANFAPYVSWEFSQAQAQPAFERAWAEIEATF